MAFQGLQSVLRQIERQYQSPQQRHWRSLNQVWPQIVGEKLAAQTRLMNIRSQVLQVAVANPILVQTLMFERSRFLKKLTVALAAQNNELIPETLITDLRFSTAGWHQAKTLDSPYHQFNSWDQHPCQSPPSEAPPKPTQTTLFQDPAIAFQRWSEQARDRYQTAPSCPQCSGPALAGELERWGFCSLCYSQSQMLRPDSSLAEPLD
ncbi:DUF721 domain-containing protein [filamentous cyanobacterium LEGE 11480]|uniref:DUF721 domain-containing protein n=1 Tax=Romeriopsis navalis LEGE 11480 TaxID=2777977 RepID=A0A928VTC7_9CYAN|nr:DUF721 domain-containing protein [Romeriopsis navalis]MBE9033342.1 DUF721 domain-containing protein [Romeriopsis navalis LEGE 11480]